MLRVYETALEFHHKIRATRLPRYLRDQALRASSSIALNLAEGYGKPTMRDRAKFFGIALGSLRECQAISDIAERSDLRREADRLGGALYQLVKRSTEMVGEADQRRRVAHRR